jgi:hypothetical protein
MIVRASALKGYTIEATDGGIGTLSDMLFDDRTWQLRWLVIDTGTFLPGRKVLIHPSAVAHAVHDQEQLLLILSRAQVEAGPDIGSDAPVSRQMESHLNDYYGWDPYWGSMFFGGGAIASRLSPPPLFGADLPSEAAIMDAPHSEGDPHLRSVRGVIGYHIEASDGAIGHVEDFQLDDRHWDLVFMMVDTRKWWSGVHVLVPPGAVRGFDWSDHSMAVDLTQAQIRESPAWDPANPLDEDYQARLNRHYGWDVTPSP